MATLPTTSNVSRPRSQGYDIDIDGNLFRLIPSPDSPAAVITKEREAIDPDSPGGRAGGGGTSEFTQFHFSNGEGLQWAHSFDAEAFDIHRYWRSQDLRIDLSFEEERGMFTVAPDTSVILSQGGSYHSEIILNNMMVHANDALFVIDANDNSLVQVSSDPLASSPTFSSEDPGTGITNLRALAALGDRVFTFDIDEIFHRETNGSWSSFLTDADFDNETLFSLWSAQERLLVETKSSAVTGGDTVNQLWEVAADGTVSSLFTLESLTGSHSVVHDVTSAGHAVLVATRHGFVYALGEAQGELELKARTPFQGEEVMSVEHSQGVVLVATRWAPEGSGNVTARLYIGRVGGDYTLQDVDLIREWEVPSDRDKAATYLTSTQNDFYFSIVTTDRDVPELWRYNLGTGGLFQYTRLHTTTSTHNGFKGLLSINDRLFNVNGVGNVRREDDPDSNFITDTNDKFVISPFIHFNSHEPKVWSYITVDANLRANETLNVQWSDDPSDVDNHSSWDQMTINSDGEGRKRYTIHGKDNASFPDPSRYLAVKFKTGDNTENPRIFNYTVAAAPTHTFQLPILISDTVKRPGRKAVRVAGLGEDIYEKLHALDEASSDGPRTLKFHRTGDEYIGLVSRVAFQEVDNPRYGGATTIALVEFVGRKVAGT